MSVHAWFGNSWLAGALPHPWVVLPVLPHFVCVMLRHVPYIYVHSHKSLPFFACLSPDLHPPNQRILSMDFTAIWFCRGCDLRKVQDEKHLLLVCPNTQKVKEHFCSALPLTHMSTLAELMHITNTVALAKFVAWAHAHYEHGRLGQVCGMLLILEDNLFSMICLLSNGLSGPKRM